MTTPRPTTRPRSWGAAIDETEAHKAWALAEEPDDLPQTAPDESPRRFTMPVMTIAETRNWTQRLWRAVRKESPSAVAPRDTYSNDEIAVMLRTLGMAMLEVGQPVNIVGSRLLTIASRYTTSAVRLAVLPTVIIVKVDTAGAKVDQTDRATVRFDQAGKIAAIVELAEAGAIAPDDAVAEVSAARELPRRFGPVTTVFGNALATIGFGMMLNPTWAALPAYALLGAVVGSVLVIAPRLPGLVAIQATVSALLVTVLAAGFLADVAGDGILRIIAPPLIALLPGFSLTTGAIELASGQMIAGASRLVYGVAQVMLLTGGVLLGVRLVGLPTPQHESALMGEWSLYAAIVVMALGMYLYLSAPRGSLIWLVVGLGVALITQNLSSAFLDEAMSGAVGAFVSVPFAIFASGFRGAPPTTVMLLTAYWGLVPGSLSFMNFAKRATSNVIDVNTFQGTGTAVFGIALGMLIGYSVFLMFTSSRHRGSAAFQAA